MRSIRWFAICCLILFSGALSGCKSDTTIVAAEHELKEMGYQQITIHYNENFKCAPTDYGNVFFEGLSPNNQFVIGLICIKQMQDYPFNDRAKSFSIRIIQ